jgi:hypothetical protein
LIDKLQANFRRYVVLAGGLTAALAIGYYLLLIRGLGWVTDIQFHVRLLHRASTGPGAVPANFGFYAVVHLLSGLACEPGRLLNAAIVVVGLAWGGLVVASAYGGVALLQLPMHEGAGVAARRKAIALVAAVGSCLLFPLPPSPAGWYLGLLPPNVYHNSTIISAMPFSVLAFAVGCRRLAGSSLSARRDDLALAGLLVVGAVFKPGFAFAFVPAYAGLFGLQHWRQGRQLGRLALVLLPVVLLVAGQLRWTSQHPQDILNGASVLAVAFPAGWHTFVPDFSAARVLACAASSFLVPVAAYALRPDWLRRPAHRLALLSLLAGLLLFLVVCETGPRARHGNFVWQVVAASHVLHWLILVEALAWVPASGQQRRRMLLLGLLALEVLCGVLYLMHALFAGI